MDWLKDVLENAAKVDPRYFVREDRHRPVAKIQRPYVVQPEHVIDVTVCYQHRVQIAYVRPQSLLPEIGRSIDKDRFALMFDQNGNPQPLVPRIVGQARLAIAGDRRNARRGSGSQKSKFHEGKKP
jgi:hypothetical protein